MPVTDTQLETILRYFDGELTDADEALLMQQLQQDIALQQAFDQQVLMHHFVADEQAAAINDNIYEPADAFLNRVSDVLENKKPATPVVPVVKKNFRWIAAAAAVFACLLAAFLYYYFQQKNTSNQLVKTPAKDSLANVRPNNRQPDSLAQINQPKLLPDSSVIHPVAPSLQQLYAGNYTVFQSKGIDVPVAAQTYQDLYEQRRYTLLAAKDEKDLEIKGRNDPEEEQLTVDCFTFYKALALLQLHKPDAAIQLLLPLQNGNAINTLIAYPSQWYLLMAYLQQNNKLKATEVAASIAKNAKSPYQLKAFQIKKQLSKNN